MLSPMRIKKMYANVVHSAGCMLWCGMKDHNGGKITIDGKQRYIHRVSYELAFGSLGRSRIRQTCGNKLCINPAHLTTTPIEDLREKRERLLGEAKQIETTLSFLDTYILHK